MAFSISVHRRSDDALFQSHPGDVCSDEFERWMEECWAKGLYDEPLGSDGTVYHYWHVPAHERGLPLVGAIYKEGLRVEGEVLDRLNAELDTLEAHWRGLDFSAKEPVICHMVREGGPPEETTMPLEELLWQRLGQLREAIRIAKSNDGILTIG